MSSCEGIYWKNFKCFTWENKRVAQHEREPNAPCSLLFKSLIAFHWCACCLLVNAQLLHKLHLGGDKNHGNCGGPFSNDWLSYIFFFSSPVPQDWNAWQRTDGWRWEDHDAERRHVWHIYVYWNGDPMLEIQLTSTHTQTYMPLHHGGLVDMILYFVSLFLPPMPPW